MALKASSQITLVDLTDAYSIILSTEAHAFQGDSNGAITSAQNIRVDITALCGANQVPATVGTCVCKDSSGNSITGISAAATNGANGAAILTPYVTVSVTTALNKSGVVNIPVTVGDITITKQFSFTIAAKGTTGATGATGKGISSTSITYQASSSGTTIPTGTWGTSIPSVAAGQYLWTKTVITYTSGDPSTSYTVGMMGATGAKGETGATGKGVSSTTITYQAGSSGTTAPTGTWQSTVPSVSNGQYLWTRTVINYTSGDPTTSYSIAYIGTNGNDSISMEIVSSNGLVFKNTAVATTLTAKVYKGGTQVASANIAALGAIKWYKNGGTTAVATGETLVIGAGDVTNSATYTAQLEK